MRPRLDAFVEWLARTLARVFFREVEVEGLERVPRGGPLLVVANHHNSLIDPVLLMGFLGVRPRFLAKSTLWRVPGVSALLRLAGAVPVYRRQDQGEDTGRNRETFARCFEELAAGGTVALFPEGISHDAPHLATLRTGAARIALGAESARGPIGLRILPVGLTFDAKGRFRSRALIRVGEPLAPEELPAAGAEPSPEAVRALTARIGQALAAVTLNYPSHDEARLIDRASEVFAAEDLELPARMALAEAFALRSAFIRSYAHWSARAPERVRALRERVERYDAALRRHRLRDAHVAARYPRSEVALYALGTAWLLLFWLPLAALGTALNFVPYRLLGLAARLGRTPDLPATFKLFGGFFLFPITWGVEAAVAGVAFGWPAALGTVFVAPASGWFAMRFHERYEDFFDEAEAWLRLALRRRTASHLRAERRALRDELAALSGPEPGSAGGPDARAAAAGGEGPAPGPRDARRGR